MLHSDADVLALRALGEPIPQGDQDHLASCAHCQSELDQLRAVVTTARQVGPGDVPAAAPDAVWERIAKDLDLAGDADDRAAGPSLLRPRRPLRWALVAAAAALVGVVAGIGGAALLSGRGTDPAGRVVASTDLSPVSDAVTHGTATLRDTPGGRVLDVDLQDLPTGSGYVEVWLMNADDGGAVSLGTVDRAGTSALTVPAGLPLDAFPYVDVSFEPWDGDPAHSTDSIARGRLVG